MEPGLGTGQESAKNYRGAKVRDWSGISVVCGTSLEQFGQTRSSTDQESGN